MYRITGIGTSIVLIAAGAILAWAVNVDTEGVNLNTVGVILFVVGLIGLVVSLLAGFAAGSRTSTTIVDRGPTYEEPAPRHERVVERERF
jgi:hypothetical protein